MLLAFLVSVTAGAARVAAQPAPAPAQESEKSQGSPAGTALAFLGGAATGLGAHEASHLIFDVLFDANPGVRRVEYAGIPFFAITHQPLSRRREFVVSSAGFWMQHGLDEWLLSTRPDLRRERAPFAKGMLVFNVLASGAYGVAALTRTGPPERDTRGIAISTGPSGIDERWVGVMVLGPAALDSYRYFRPHSRWAPWASRVVKVGMVLLVLW